jgi:hypothetical protein
MRPKERIKIFFTLIDWEYLSKRWNISERIDKLILNHNPYINVSEYWLENPDQRIGQVLINLEILPDTFEIWIDEEDYILKDQGIPEREYKLWGSNYDKDMNRLPETIWRPICELTTDHIEAILINGYANNYIVYKNLFEKELELRSEK